MAKLEKYAHNIEMRDELKICVIGSGCGKSSLISVLVYKNYDGRGFARKNIPTSTRKGK